MCKLFIHGCSFSYKCILLLFLLFFLSLVHTGQCTGLLSWKDSALALRGDFASLISSLIDNNEYENKSYKSRSMARWESRRQFHAKSKTSSTTFYHCQVFIIIIRRQNIAHPTFQKLVFILTKVQYLHASTVFQMPLVP